MAFFFNHLVIRVSSCHSPMSPSAPTHTSESSQMSSQLASSAWLGWSPPIVGVLAFFLFSLPMLATIWNMQQRANLILQDSIKHQLLGAARTIAQRIDGDVHRSLKTAAQEQSEAYIQQIQQMDHAKAALDTNGMIKYVYTCIKQTDKIQFVLDTTATGDSDGDGKDDKAHIMEVYEKPSAALISVFNSGTAAVDHVPYQDRWGTFMSAYAPIYDEQHALVGVVGVDMALGDYNLQLSSIWNLSLICAIGIICLSYIAAHGAAAYHRRLQRSVRELVATSAAAMVAARTKADFLATMSHELRTPLNAVIGMSELLHDTPLDSTQKSYVSTIQNSGESLLDTLTDILDFSQLDAGRIHVERLPVSLKFLFNGLKTHFQQALETKQLTLNVDIGVECPRRFWGDPEHIRQVLRHLIMNAIKFTDAGFISIRVSGEVLSTGQLRLHFQVKDSGVGIPKEHLKGLFTPFFQADGSTTRHHGGTGIGLAICKRLCDAMKGDIWVESEVGKGSVFHAVIPAEAVADPITATSGHKALVWSQDTMTQILVNRVLEKQGLITRIVTTFQELLDELRSQSFHWLLLDAQLLTDDQLIPIKELGGNARIIVLNAETGRVFNVEFEAVLPQPVRPADLRLILES